MRSRSVKMDLVTELEMIVDLLNRDSVDFAVCGGLAGRFFSVLPESNRSVGARS